ncbi:MAG: DUF1338 domain-containing protein [Kofleriaceae bacterium]
MKIDEILTALWADYVSLTPQADKIHALLAARGEAIVNDHVALRTFDCAGGLAALAAPFEAVGYVCAADRYRFADKKLNARYWKHPDPARPKLFISELCTRELSTGAQQIIDALVAQLPAAYLQRADLPWAGRPWACTRAQYETLLAESEYAAWMAAFGFRVNHFTVLVNALTTFADLPALNAFLIAHSFTLNAAGGVIKGTPSDHLEQSSTLADRVPVELAGEMVSLPSVYYEFAKRYPLANGELFAGFVPTSADKIFESTNAKA